MNNLLRSLTLALLCLAAFGAHAERTMQREINPDRIVGTERPIETGSAAVLMPGSENGTLTVNQCANCRAERLTVNAKTRYYAGTQQVTLAELKALLDPGHPVSMTIFAELRQPVVLRVIADVKNR
jgi:hypothetical protein